MAWLNPDTPPAQLISGRFSDALATGTITADALVGSLAGITLNDLATKIRDRNFSRLSRKTNLTSHFFIYNLTHTSSLNNNINEIANAYLFKTKHSLNDLNLT